MIPKKIHYCWFGHGAKSELIESCIKSWRQYLPEYEIIEWNEANFDIASNLYVKQAYGAKKWAFVSDYVRLYALYTCGGIYLDTDVEILKSFDPFLNNTAFTGFEANDSPVTAVLGAEKNSPIIGLLLNYYHDHTFIKHDGSFDLKTNTVTITEILTRNGIVPNGKMQEVAGIRVYPQIYFCPNNISRIWDTPSKKTFAIHHFEGSWKNGHDNSARFPNNCKRYMVGLLRNIIGTKNVSKIRNANRKKKG